MPTTRRAFARGLVGLAVIGATRAARAEGLPTPTGKPILTVSGKIDVFNDDRTAKFDRTMLEALGMTGFTTATPWYDGQTRFDGVLMARLMQTVRAAGDTLLVTALNDYETKIPISDLTEFNVLLALKRDGEYMSVRDKGPLFMIYPFDSNPALKSQKYFGRSAWQVARIVIT